MSRRPHRRPGVTLPELLLASFLFLLVMGVLASGIMLTLRGHEHGQEARDAQEKCRQALDRMVAELRTAAALPSLGGTRPPVPSGVLWPDSYGNEKSGFYALEVVTLPDGSTVHQARNRLILSRPGVQIDSDQFNPVALNHYVYVLYQVPEEQPNRLLRRVYRVSQGGGHDFVSGQWRVVEAYFQGTQGLLTDPEEEVVVDLPGPNDRIAFTVSHPRYISDVTGLAGTEAGFNTSYDRHLFTVEMSVAVAHRNDPHRKTEQILKGQARIPSGN